MVFLCVNKSKDVKFILDITKKEAKQLRKMGVPEKDGGISSSTTKHHYWLCDDYKGVNRKLLRQIRKSL